MYTVYAKLPRYDTATVVDTYYFREGALHAIEKYLNRHPTAVCYVNDENYGYTRQDFE